MQLDASQIASFASGAGFQGADLVTAVAIALAESSGSTTAYNPETQAGAAPGMGSYGVWQIFLSAHPEFAGVNLYDPATNAQAAYSVYSGAGQRFTAWATYKSGAYLKYLGTAQAGILSAAGVTSNAANDQISPVDNSTADTSQQIPTWAYLALAIGVALSL